jgi:hypothetical protein
MTYFWLAVGSITLSVTVAELPPRSRIVTVIVCRVWNVEKVCVPDTVKGPVPLTVP